MRVMKSVLISVGLVAACLGCSGGGGGGNRVIALPQGGEGTVTVSVGAGSFNGFDIIVDYPEDVVSPTMPVAGSMHGGGMMGSALCEGQQDGTTLRYSCANANPLAGPGDLVHMTFTWDGRDPAPGEFDVLCVFHDQDGHEVQRTCTMTLAL